MMKIAVAGEMVLTRSHILLTDINLSAKVDQPSNKELRKLKKGILVDPETGKCMNNVPQSLEQLLMDNDGLKSLYVDIQTIASFQAIRKATKTASLPTSAKSAKSSAKAANSKSGPSMSTRTSTNTNSVSKTKAAKRKTVTANSVSTDPPDPESSGSNSEEDYSGSGADQDD